MDLPEVYNPAPVAHQQGAALGMDPSLSRQSSISAAAAGLNGARSSSSRGGGTGLAASLDDDTLGPEGGSDFLVRPGGWCAVFDASGCVDEGDGETHRKGVAKNFAMVHRAAKSLGAVPEMLSSKDFADHGPDERAVILYVAFLCSRLLEVSKEERAAHTIQCAWQAHKNRAVGKGPAQL